MTLKLNRRSLSLMPSNNLEQPGTLDCMFTKKKKKRASEENIDTLPISGENHLKHFVYV